MEACNCIITGCLRRESIHQVLKVTMTVFVLLMSILTTSIIAADSDPFPNVTLPVHAKAINPTTKYNSPFSGAKASVYKIKMSFPAQDLTDFYDSQLKKMGYERFPQGGDDGTFEWMNFNNRSGQWEKTTALPARYTAAWVNQQRTLKIWLYIAYKYDGANPEWTTTPFVSVNMGKLSDLKDAR